MIDKNRAAGCFIGLACGDAVGTTLEFQPKGSFKPIKDMVGGGPFNLIPGQWTDDTSMALCLAESLSYCEGFNPKDQMNRYCNWNRYGYMSSTGECFDVGNTVASALEKYLETGQPFSGSLDEYSSGNGSLMRLAPIPIFYHKNLEDCIVYAGQSSRTTHGSEECIDSCKLFSSLLYHAMRVVTKEEVFINNSYCPATENVESIANRNFLGKDYTDLTGSGYVIESLESALWCFLNSDSFEEAILLAANIGNDADTTAAICGQVAGAFYGLDKIPESWKSKIYMYDAMIELTGKLLASGNNNAT
ncbi:MAG: ADP-ribosylglycohydrolase family protein [Gammaproteobacteria bacterium]|nr:ADP-ribosylglycohydrolase family protein [Gammaproteobacteria bacterium]